jgi:hypothetical protein
MRFRIGLVWDQLFRVRLRRRIRLVFLQRRWRRGRIRFLLAVLCLEMGVDVDDEDDGDDW